MTFITSGSATSFFGGILLAVITAVALACTLRPRRSRHQQYRRGTVTSSIYAEGVVTATSGFVFRENARNGKADGISVDEPRSSGAG
jgi:hypothetical protein